MKHFTLAQQQVCLRAITCSGLDNDVDMRNALSEHLNVVSSNIVRCALREACLGSLKKQDKPLLMAKNVFCRLELLNVIKIGQSMIGRR